MGDQTLVSNSQPASVGDHAIITAQDDVTLQLKDSKLATVLAGSSVRWVRRAVGATISINVLNRLTEATIGQSSDKVHRRKRFAGFVQ